MKKYLLIAILLMTSASISADNANDEVAEIFAKIQAYNKASKDTKQYNSTERQRLNKAEKQLKKYLETHYERITIDPYQDLSKKASVIDEDLETTIRGLNMFKGVSKKDMDLKIKYINGEIKELPKEKKN